MSKQWFVRQQGKVYGPFDAVKLRALASARKIGPNTDLANSQAGPWTKAGQVKGLLATETNEAAARPPSPSPQPLSVAVSAANHQRPALPSQQPASASNQPPLPTPALQIQTRTHPVRLWNPRAAINWSVLFLPLGAFLHAANWKALGKSDRVFANLVWAWSFVAFIVVNLFVVFIPVPNPTAKIIETIARVVGLTMLAGWAWTQGHPQVKFVKESLGGNYKKKSLGVPLGVSFAVLSAIGGLLVLKYYDPHQTETAAISLLKQSLQDTFENKVDVQKPVKVLQVQLDQGKGRDRSGTAVLSFGGISRRIPFKAQITNSFSKGLQIEWETSQETLEASEDHQETSAGEEQLSDAPRRSSRPTDRSGGESAARSLDGEWIVVSQQVGDVKLKGEEVVEINPEKLVVHGRTRFELKITGLQWDTSPKQIDFEAQHPERGAIALYGAFEYDGKNLVLCISPNRLSAVDVKRVPEDVRAIVMQRATPQALSKVYETNIARNELKQIGLAYLGFEAARNKFPRSWDEFREWPDIDTDLKHALESGRYVLLYGPRFTEGYSKTVIGYARDVPQSGGLVLFGDGHVEELTAEEFRAKPLASEITGSGK